MQNEDIIIREYFDLPRIRKKEMNGYINFEIVQNMPINLENYIVKYKVLNIDKKTMNFQLILFPKYIKQICSEIAENLKINRKYLNINFDILQKLINKKKIDLKLNKCIIMENYKDEIILNLVKDNKICNSNMFEKDGNLNYILNFMEEDMHIFYYGDQDDFINKICKNGFKVDKLKLDLRVNDLRIEKDVDKNISKYVINIGLVV